MYSPETLDQLQDELVGLLRAWVDRGIPVEDASMLLAATGHTMIVEYTKLSFGQLVEMILKQWKKHNGKI